MEDKKKHKFPKNGPQNGLRKVVNCDFFGEEV